MPSSEVCRMSLNISAWYLYLWLIEIKYSCITSWWPMTFPLLQWPHLFGILLQNIILFLKVHQVQSVSLSKTTTIFQAEMLALSTALTIFNSCVNTSIALITDSMSAMQSLQNPAVRIKTKLSCINQINSVVQSNQLALIWIPGKAGRLVGLADCYAATVLADNATFLYWL